MNAPRLEIRDIVKEFGGRRVVDEVMAATNPHLSA